MSKALSIIGSILLLFLGWFGGWALGANYGGNYAVDFEAFGLRGYEATAAIGAHAGLIIAALVIFHYFTKRDKKD